ncbi:MAG TPA: DUF3823 domain-containing protein [Rhodothermales bacterium]|nr:DUF3823 domain-containing protein [Rhodothermales bacterium]
MRLQTTIAVISLTVTVTGCDNIFGLDNFDAPGSALTGQIVFEGQPVGVRMGGVQLELWEPGWDFDEKIPIFISEDGSFSATLFDGDYELNLLPGNGPWIDNPNRLQVQVRGNTSVDIPVAPYYTIENPILLNRGDSIHATFTIRSVNPTRLVEFAGLYVGKTIIVDRNNMAVRREVARSSLQLDTPVTISLKLPDDIHLTPSPDPREQVFVRIGVKTLGVAELLYSPVEEVPL